MTEWHGADYSQQSSLQQAMAAEVIRKLDFRGSERVLDVGCGDGKITASIAARVPSGAVLGIDPSRDMIDFATRQHAASQANLRFEVADVRRLAYQSEFDLVTSFNALHWVAEQREALTAIRNGLKPDGRARLRFVSKGPRMSLEDVIEEVRQEVRWSGSFHGFRKPHAHFTPEAYRALAEEAGFRVAELAVEDKEWDFQSRDAFTAFAHATFVEWTQRLPASQVPDFISDVLDRYEGIAAMTPAERNTFKFYQMEILLTLD